MVSTRSGHSDPTTSKHRATELQSKVTSTNATNNPWDVLYDIGYDCSYLGLFGGFLNMVVPQIIQVMDDHDLVLKPAVTTGDPPMVAVNG